VTCFRITHGLTLSQNKITTGLFRYVELSNTNMSHKPEDTKDEIIYLYYPNGELTKLNVK